MKLPTFGERCSTVMTSCNVINYAKYCRNEVTACYLASSRVTSGCLSRELYTTSLLSPTVRVLRRPNMIFWTDSHCDFMQLYAGYSQEKVKKAADNCKYFVLTCCFKCVANYGDTHLSVSDVARQGFAYLRAATSDRLPITPNTSSSVELLLYAGECLATLKSSIYSLLLCP